MGEEENHAVLLQVYSQSNKKQKQKNQSTKHYFWVLSG